MTLNTRYYFILLLLLLLFFFFFVFSFLFFWLIEFPRVLVASGLQVRAYARQGSKPHLRSTAQLVAMSDLQPTEQGQGLNPHPQGFQLDSFPLCHKGNSLGIVLNDGGVPVMS